MTRKFFPTLAFACTAGIIALTGCSSKDDYALANDVNALDARLAKLEGQPATRQTVSRSMLGDVPQGYTRVHMAVPTGVEATSAVLVEKMMPESVTAGEQFEYYIRVTNLTDNLNLSRFQVMDTFTENFNYASSNPNASVSGDTATWNLGTLAPNQSEMITVMGSGPRVGETATCAIVDYKPELCHNTIVEKPELEVEYRGTEQAITCDPLTYVATVRNTGSGAAENVVLSGELPSGLTTTDGSRTFTQSFGTLAAGESREFSFNAEAERAGNYTSNFTVTSDNVASLESNTVTTDICQPELAIESIGTERIYLGNDGRFESTVTVPSDCGVDNVIATATFPNCTRILSSNGGTISGNTVTWNLGNMAGGSTQNLTVDVNAASICEEQVSFRAEGVCAEAVADTVPVEILGIPAILLEVIDLTDPVKVGSTTTYVITATNQGSRPDTNISIVARVEDMNVLNTSGATDATVDGKEIVFRPLPTLGVGQQAEWRIEVEPTAEGDQRFFVEMTTGNLQRPVNETEATNTYE